MNGTTNQPNLLDLASQGNVQALTALINRQLQSKDITTKTTLTQGCFTVIAESENVPDQAFLVDFIRKGITNLKSEAIQRVIVQGRITGKATPVWREAFELQSAVTANHQQPASSNKSSIDSSTASLKSQLNLPKNDKLTSRFLTFIKGTSQLSNTALLFGILLVSMANLFAVSKSQPTLWEYKVEPIPDGGFEQIMHQMGSEGWEVASARRAVSGEGSSSEGLYEVIFKRPATKTQIRENDKKLKAEALASALQATQALPRIEIGAINRAQHAFFLENNALASTIDELGLNLKLESENYAYSLTNEQSKSLVTATAKTDDLKSYTGAVFLVQEADGSMTTVALTCQTDAPSKTPPASPELNGSQPVCPAGSSDVKVAP